jgi:hypothetical protein
VLIMGVVAVYLMFQLITQNFQSGDFVGEIYFLSGSHIDMGPQCSIKWGIYNRMNTLNNTHTTKSKINTPMFCVVKTTIHGPSQCGHLRQYINAKQKYCT